MFNLRFVTALICLLGIITANIAIADTEISGAVSGEWTSEGSPYIVVDSTWVPEGETLTVRSNVDLLFAENQGLYIFGLFQSIGIDGYYDSVRIHLVEDAEHWMGLRFYGENHGYFAYTHIECPDTAILLDQNCSLAMEYCEIEADYQSIWGYQQYHSRHRGWNLQFNHCEISGGMLIVMTGGSVVAEDTNFDFGSGNPTNMPGFSTAGTSITMIRCGTDGGIHGTRETIIEDCFFRTWGQNDNDYGISIEGENGHMLRTYSEMSVSISGCYQGVMPFEDNIIVSDFSAYSGRFDIRNNEFLGGVGVGEGYITFSNNVVHGPFGSSWAITTVDSCIFYGTRGNWWFYCDGIGEFTVTRSVVRGYHIYLFGEVGEEPIVANFDHNTFIFVNEADYPIRGYRCFATYTNNAFISDISCQYLFKYALSVGNPIMEYNCYWQFDSYLRDLRNGNIEDFPPTNLDCNPMFDEFCSIPFLSPNSPCIDAGDPEAPPDPDGTRSDIGAIAFYQPNSIWTPDKEYTQVPDNFSSNVFPNPFNNAFNIMLPLENRGSVSVSIFDMNGRKIFQTNHSSKLGVISIDAANFPTGEYLVHLKSDKYSQTIPVSCLK